MGTSGQIAIAGSVAFSSLSSTALLQLVSTPYVYALFEDKQKDTDSAAKDSTVAGNRNLYAVKVDFFGRMKGYSFPLSDTDKNPKHPFASFTLKSSGENFYIYGDGIAEDPQLRQRLCKD